MKKTDHTTFTKHVEATGTLMCYRWEWKWCSLENRLIASQKVKHTTMWPCHSTIRCCWINGYTCPRQMNSFTHTKNYMEMFIAALLVIYKNWNWRYHSGNFQDDEKVQYLDWGVDYKILYIYEKSLNYIFRSVHFTDESFILKWLKL